MDVTDTLRAGVRSLACHRTYLENIGGAMASPDGVPPRRRHPRRRAPRRGAGGRVRGDRLGARRAMTDPAGALRAGVRHAGGAGGDGALVGRAHVPALAVRRRRRAAAAAGGLTVETMDGSAWVGLVPFFLRVGLPGVPSVPWLSRFAETNVRTYVTQRRRRARHLVLLARRGPPRRGGHRAGDVPHPVLLVEDVDRAHRLDDPVPVPAALARARGVRAATSSSTSASRTSQTSWRSSTTSSPPAGRSTARRGRACTARLAFHDPWPLHRARAVRVDDELVRAAGLPEPEGEPLVHYSPSVAGADRLAHARHYLTVFVARAPAAGR